MPVMASRKNVVLRAKDVTRMFMPRITYCGVPVMEHLERVVARLGGESADMRAVGWMHLILEYGNIVPDALYDNSIPDYLIRPVIAMTPTGQETTYGEYLSRIAQNPIAARVKLAAMLECMTRTITTSRLRKYSQAIPILMDSLGYSKNIR